MYVLQVPSVPGNGLYYVRVGASNPGGPRSVGNYFLGVDFSTVSTDQATLVTNHSDTASAPTSPSMTFNANVDVLFHFTLSADCAGAPAGSGVEMTVYDAAGHPVATLLSRAGESQSVNLFLAQGSYTFHFRSVNSIGLTIAPTYFTLRGLLLSDPVRPYQYDPTADPSSPPPSGGSGSGSGGTATTSNGTYSTTVW
jgi:hypothetical protein